MNKDELLAKYRKLDKETDITLYIKNGKLDMDHLQLNRYNSKLEIMTNIASALGMKVNKRPANNKAT